jgi:DNA ligase-1
LSEIIDFNNWEELHEIREKSREINSEGLMLKSKNSIYHAGRKKAIGGNGKLLHSRLMRY